MTSISPYSAVRQWPATTVWIGLVIIGALIMRLMGW